MDCRRSQIDPRQLIQALENFHHVRQRGRRIHVSESSTQTWND